MLQYTFTRHVGHLVSGFAEVLTIVMKMLTIKITRHHIFYELDQGTLYIRLWNKT